MTKTSTTAHSQRGYLMTEIVVALFILQIMMGGALILFRMESNHLYSFYEETLAREVAGSQLETFRERGFPSLNEGDHPLLITQDGWKNLKDASCSMSVQTDDAPSLLQVRVVVKWTDKGGHLREVAVGTLVSKNEGKK